MTHLLNRPVFTWLCCALGPVAVLLLNSDVVFGVGFPLDDAWIHAVYGRSLLQEGALTYNPGEGAAGESAPLWAIVSALAQQLSMNPSVFPAITKLLGLALHAMTCWLIASCSLTATRNASLSGFAALTVGLNPDLLAGAVSGMEVPLATLAAAVAWRLTQLARPVPLALAATLFCWGRPEAMGFFLAIPVGFLFFRSPRAKLLTIAAAAGTLVGGGSLALRTWLATGRPLPSTFYAKAHAGGAPLHLYWEQAWALRGLIGVVAIVGVATALWRSSRARTLNASAEGAVLCLAGASFFVSVCALIPPIDPSAFYHQRYVLPALTLLLPGSVLMGAHAAPRNGLLVSALVLLMSVPTLPSRLTRLTNDARNIDDVQVAMGRLLAQASAEEEVWTIDAGAVRYFARGHVVDLMGLNTPQLLDARAIDYLNAHPPRFLALLDSWTRHTTLPSHTLTTSTPYTVTSSVGMGHQSLLQCPPDAGPQRLVVFSRTFDFVCAP